MQCPVCRDTKLAITDRQGIEIDYCPECRGVWLDRGELDKLIERSAEREREHGEFVESHKKKHKSLLHELLDI